MFISWDVKTLVTGNRRSVEFSLFHLNTHSFPHLPILEYLGNIPGVLLERCCFYPFPCGLGWCELLIDHSSAVLGFFWNNCHAGFPLGKLVSSGLTSPKSCMLLQLWTLGFCSGIVATKSSFLSLVPFFIILICKGIEIHLWSRDQPILWTDLELLRYVWVCLWVGVIIAVFCWEPRNKYFKRLKWPRKGTLLSPLELLDRIVSKALVPRSLRDDPPSYREQWGRYRTRGTWSGSTLVKNKEQQHYFARIFRGEFTPEAAVELSSCNEEPG